MYRRQRAGSAPSPTAARILQEAVAVLNDDGVDRFQIQRVIERSGVRRATVYNHYSDVDTLIEAALLETFGQELRQNRDTVSQLIDASPDLPTFRAAFRTFVDQLSQTPASVRLRRTHTLALTSTRPAFAAAISATQDEVTEVWVDIMRRGQERGFIRPELDARAAAVLVQSAGLGRIVDDTASEPLGNERWAAMFFDMVDRTILLPA